MMNSTRSKSVINIFVLRVLPEQTGIVLFFQARSQPEDTHLDDEEYKSVINIFVLRVLPEQTGVQP